MTNTEPTIGDNSGEVDASHLKAFIERATLAEFVATLCENEVWRPIPQFTSYEVSSHGRIRRIGAGLIKPTAVQGYPRVCLCEGGIKANRTVHRCVALSFLGSEPFEGAIVAHRDGNPSNNRLDNLRWASAKENQVDRARHYTKVRGSRVRGAKLREEDIPAIRDRIRAGLRYEDIGNEFGVSISTISLINKNRTWRHAHGAAWGIEA